ncbi:paraquat-inducible protein A [Roseovarius nanhaiticus]|uniref:paraquat-inducible protein A n=1 Tax=Roseovarius nanhaiticus TaxID=573024 RepID=UPI0024917B34|nr:paraquat-inducible protein A [Roseovarius nanhaiticus]
MKTAKEMNLIGCRRCTRVSPPGTEICPRCGGKINSRDPRSLQKVMAWWVLGVACYIPANLYTMLETKTLVSSSSSTIIGGAVEIAQYGSWGVAIIILLASAVIPIGKFIIILGLVIGVKRGPQISDDLRQKLYEVVEYIGRWSMIDVFVVAVLSSLVQLQTLVNISPGRASIFFALSVIFTMISAQSFDSRLIWDTGRKPAPDGTGESRDASSNAAPVTTAPGTAKEFTA